MSQVSVYPNDFMPLGIIIHELLTLQKQPAKWHEILLDVHIPTHGSQHPRRPQHPSLLAFMLL